MAHIKHSCSHSAYVRECDAKLVIVKGGIVKHANAEWLQFALAFRCRERRRGNKVGAEN